MPKARASFERHLNAVILLLAGLALIVALGFMLIDGFWSGIGTMGILLIVILVAALPSRGH